MPPIKYLERIYYKIITDLFNTLIKLDFLIDGVSIYTQDITTHKISLLDHTLKSLQLFIGSNGILNSCDLGNNIYLNKLKLTTRLIQSDIQFSIFDVIGSVVINSDSILSLSVFENQIKLNKVNTLTSLLNVYRKVYLYIVNMRTDSSDSYYSKCYADKFWADDLISTGNYELFLKYNVFDLKSQEIPPKELSILKTILS